MTGSGAENYVVNYLPEQINTVGHSKRDCTNS